MKKILSFLILLSLAFSLFGCGRFEKINVRFDEKTGTLTVSGKGTVTALYRRYNDPAFHVQYDFEGFEIPQDPPPDPEKSDSAIKKLVIKEGITALDDCFNDLIALEEVVLPKSLILIESSFRGCYNLPAISFPGKTTIRKDSFNDCTALKSVTFHGPIETCHMEGGAFNGCGSLTELTIPAGSVLCDAFNECDYLERITLEKDIILHPITHQDYDCHYSFYTSNMYNQEKRTFYLPKVLYEEITNRQLPKRIGRYYKYQYEIIE